MHAEVKGTTLPILEVTLDRGEELVSSHGELAWMTPGIQLSQTAGTGGTRGLMQGLKRMAGGGGLFLTRYQGPGVVTFAAKLPGSIMAVDIDDTMPYLVHRHGWLCGTAGIVPSVGLQQTFRGGMWGGDGFLLQKLAGQGRAWIELSGELTVYDLPAGQTLLVHPGHVGMFQGSVQFTIQRVPGIANAVFGVNGFHLVALTGPGRIWLQSLPLPGLAHALAPYLGADSAKEAAGAGAVGGIVGSILRG
jgi:uncharacterized protein (AIM24 family)